MNVGVQYAPLIIFVYCTLHNFCRIKNDTRIMKGEELEDVTSNNINLNRLRQPIFEQAISRVGVGQETPCLVVGKKIWNGFD